MRECRWFLSDVEHGATSGTATPTGSDSAANQVLSIEQNKTEIRQRQRQQQK